MLHRPEQNEVPSGERQNLTVREENKQKKMIKIEPGVASVDTSDNNLEITTVKDKPQALKKVKLGPSYPITKKNPHQHNVRGKIFKCKYCLRLFTRKSSFTRHLRRHGAEVPGKCKICRKTFPYRFNLEEHLRTHAGEKPFKCKVCNRGFGRKSHLIRHTRTVKCK